MLSNPTTCNIQFEFGKLYLFLSPRSIFSSEDLPSEKWQSNFRNGSLHVSYIIVSTSALINSRRSLRKARSERRKIRRLSLEAPCLFLYNCRPSSFAYTFRMVTVRVCVRKNRGGAGFNRALVFGVNETGRDRCYGEGKRNRMDEERKREREDPNGAHRGDHQVCTGIDPWTIAISDRTCFLTFLPRPVLFPPSLSQSR